MAEPKRSFPMLPVGHWWALRKKFQQSIPGNIPYNYLATVLCMEAESARANVLPFLKTLGILDEDGKPKERARLWRDDGHYPEVCEAILKEVYPQELLDIAPGPKVDRELAEKWFAHQTGAGVGACRRMAALYAVLVDADPHGETLAPKPRSAAKPKTAKPQRATATRNESIPTAPGTPAALPSGQLAAPGININMQIHISADTPSDQIDRIFAAMAKHICQRP